MNLVKPYKRAHSENERFPAPPSPHFSFSTTEASCFLGILSKEISIFLKYRNFNISIKSIKISKVSNLVVKMFYTGFIL